MDEIDPVDDTEGTVFRDLIMLTLLGFVTMVILMIPHLNPPTEAATARPPGNIVVEARWAVGADADVDLWVKGPDDAPVGYSRKSGTVFDLLRDDLGRSRDATDQNFEFAYSRGAPAGAYAVNLHLYDPNQTPLPVEVTVEVSARDSATGRLTRIDRHRVRLTRRGEEITVVRFRLDGQGGLVAGSVNRLPIPLRSSR